MEERRGKNLGQSMRRPQDGIFNDVSLVVGDEVTAQGIQITPAGQNGHYEESHTRPRPTLHLLPQRTNQKGWWEIFPVTVTYYFCWRKYIVDQKLSLEVKGYQGRAHHE